MVNEILVRWYLKPEKAKYYVLDWMFVDQDQEAPAGFEKEEITPELIEEMTEITPDNLELLGYFRTEEELQNHVEDIEEEADLEKGEYGAIQWDGADFYVRWGEDEIIPALHALDVEYDIAHESGPWLSWVTGWIRDELETTLDVKECLLDVYGCDIDSLCEQEIEDYILSFFDESELDKEDKTIISDDINNFRLSPIKLNEILGDAGVRGRIDPATLP
jgi:hypothetical protein